MAAGLDSSLHPAPWKINMELTNGGGWKVMFSISSGWFWNSMSIFQGVFICISHSHAFATNKRYSNTMSDSSFPKTSSKKITMNPATCIHSNAQEWCTILQVQAANMPCQRSSSWYGLGHEDWTSLPRERTATRLLSFLATPNIPTGKKNNNHSIVWSNKFKYLRSHNIDMKIRIFEIMQIKKYIYIYTLTRVISSQQAACSPFACQVSVVEWGASGGIRTHLKPLMAGDVSRWTSRLDHQSVALHTSIKLIFCLENMLKLFHDTWVRFTS